MNIRDKTMKLKCMLAFLVFVLSVFFNAKTIADDGKLLRGQKWQRFSLEGKKVDFYIATNGNDSWSGKPATPNTDKSDGPFATI